MTAPNPGFFYVIQLAPDIVPGRVKLGWSADPVQRLAQHRTAAPTATLVATWPCHREWERAAILAVGGGARRISGEVFDVDDVPTAVALARAFLTEYGTQAPRRVRKEAAAPYQPPDGYLTMAQAQARWSVSKATAQKMVREAALEAYRDPRNKRVSLFKIEDVEKLMQPVLKARAA